MATYARVLGTSLTVDGITKSSADSEVEFWDAGVGSADRFRDLISNEEIAESSHGKDKLIKIEFV